jgi:hypothetical protein
LFWGGRYLSVKLFTYAWSAGDSLKLEGIYVNLNFLDRWTIGKCCRREFAK